MSRYSELVLATGNRGKAAEMRAMLASRLGPDVRLLTLADFPTFEMPEESEKTFCGNALQKARGVCLATGLACLADDSGLCVDCLGGEPGIYSRRWAGNDITDQERCSLLLTRLSSVGAVEAWQRTAKFVACIAAGFPDGTYLQTEGLCTGWIADQPRGSDGFGYDPVFVVSSYGRTMSEITLNEKNQISHRSAALNSMVELLIRRHLFSLRGLDAG